MKLTKRLLAMLLTVVMVLTMLPAIALTASAAYSGTGTFTKATGTLSSGYYVFGVVESSSVHAINNTAGTSWIKYTDATISSNKLTNPATSIVWYYDASAGTFQNVGNNNYIYWTSGNVGCCGSTSYAHTVTETGTSGIYTVASKATSGRILRRNGTSGYRYYTSSTGSQDISFFKLDESAPSYTLTAQSNNTSYGTVGTPSNGTVVCTPTSNAYYVASATVTSGAGLTVAVNGNTVTYTGTQTANAVITVNFAAKQSATISLSENGTARNPGGTHYAGDSYTLPTTTNAAVPSGYVFMGWSTVTIPTPGSAPTSNYYEKGASVTLAGGTNTFYAVYAQASGTSEVTSWNLVTAAPSDWNGEYVIANNASSSASVLIADGSVTGTAYSSATAVKTLSAAGMTYDSTTQTLSGVTDAYTFVVSDAATSGKHYIKMKGAASNLYLIANSTTGSSSVSTATSTGTTAEWSISYGTSSPYLVGNSGRYMGWNASYFRAYAATNKDTYTLQLFKKTTSGGTSYVNYTTAPVEPSVDTYTLTITQPSANGTISTSDTLIELLEGDIVTLTANPATGYEIDEWIITGAADAVESGNDVAIEIGTSDVTATVSFQKINYTITKNAGSNGSITAAASANYGDAVSFTVTPDAGYQINTLTVAQTSGGAAVAYTGSGTSYQITSMPAANVTIAATFSLIPTYDYTFYGPNNSTVASGNAATVTAPAGSPASITYTYPGETTPTTFTFAGWVAGQAQLTTPGAASGEIIPAGTPITLSANTTYRAVYAPSGSGGNGFKLSLESGGTTYYVGPRSSNNSYLDYPTDAADAASFVLEEDPNNAGHYFMYYTSGANKIYIYNSSTQAGSDTGMEFTTNTAPSGSGYIYWVESISNGVATYQNVNSSGTGTRYLAFNSNRFSTYGTTYAYEFTKTGGAAYLTEPGANYYAVTYNENAGGDTVTNMPDNGAVQEGTSYTIPNTVPVRDGYRFDGWATSSSGSVAYAAGSLPATISNVTAAIDLYAKWSAVPQATVTFYEADNTTTYDTASVYEGVAPTAPATNPTKAPSGAYYYTFSGWSRTAGGAVESPMTAIASGESTRAYYPVFTQNVATFTLTFSGRTKVATEGSFNTSVLQPRLTTTQEGCSAVVTGLTINSGTNNSIATVTTDSNALTVTGVSAGTLTLSVTATFAGGTATGTVTITVIAGNGGTAGGYKLITIDNTAADVSDYDWTGEYIMVARPNGLAANFNTLEVMQFVWTDDTTATIADSNQNRAEFDLGSATQDDFGVATAANGSVTIHAIHTGEGDYVEGASTTEDGMIYDRITGFTDGSDNDITNQYVLVFERVDDVNNYYTIRVKGTNYYLTNSSTALSGGNTMGGNASPGSIGAQLMWHLRWAGSADTIDGRASNTITLNGENFTPDSILIESVEALNYQSGVSRAILYNQSGHMFRVYGEGAYVTNGPLIGVNGGYNLFLYGKNNPFEAEIVYDGTPRNTTTDKITVPWNYATQAGNSTLLLEGVLDPESYPGWTILNSGIPTWTLIGAYNPNGTTFSSATSISAISGTENANFNVANWVASDVGKYYVVKINYQVQDSDGVTHDVPQQAMIVVGNDTNTYTTVIHEATSQSNTGSYTVPSRIGSTGVDLDAYVRDNYSEIYTDRAVVNGYTTTQPSEWSYTSQKGYTYTISAAGVVTWDPAQVTTDDTVEITATASITNGETTPTVAAGSITLYIKQLAYSGEVVATPDSSVTEIPYGDTAFAVTLDNFRNNDNAAPGSSTYSINAATAWNWTASTINGTAVPITRTSTGATIDVTGLATGTEVIVRATNVIASSNVVANTHTVVTITGKIFTVGEDNSMAAVNDSFVLDFDRDARLNVLANDRNAEGATLTLGAAPTGVTLTKNNDNTITFGVPGGQLTTATYTFTYTLSKSGETDSTATVTVKPSSAIYYEDTNDDFFTYTDGTRGRWSEVGADNGWLQDASAVTDGYDAANNSLTWSAGIAHKANVGKDTSYGNSSASGTWPKVEFTFVGNAFALSMMRNNYTGLVAVYVDGTKVKNLPTAYGATGGEYDPSEDYGGFIYESSDSNYGMPAFYWAAENGTAGTHSVKVEVLYSSMYDHNSPKSNYDVYIDGVTIYNPIAGTTAYKYISFRDTVLATGSLGVPATQAHDYAATLAPSSISIGIGTTGTLQLSLTDEGATVYSGYTVVYSSSDTSIATVTTNGSLNTSTGVNTATVTGVSEGTVTITATITTPGGTTLTRTATVNVTDTVYTVTYKLPNGDQEVTYGTERINLGSGVTHLTAAELAEYNAHPYVFRGWAPAAVNDTTTQPGGLLDNNMSITLSGDATYYAVYTYGTTTEDFQLKTDLTNPLVDGETIVIYETEGTGDKYLLSNQDYSSTWNEWRLGVAATPSNGYVKTNNTNLYWTVEATSGGFYLKDQDGNYLTATATDGRLVMTSSPDAKAIWNATTTGVTGANSVFIYNSEASPKYLQHFSGYAEFGAYTFDDAYSNKNEMQIFVQQPNNLTYTTDLQSTTVRYTVNYWVNGTAMTSEQIAEGNNPSFPNVTGAYTELAGYSHDYTFLGWIPSTISPDTSTAPATIYTAGDTYAVNAATAFYAVFTYTGTGSAAEGYSLSDSAPEAGDNFIIAAKIDGTYYALNHSRSTTALTITNGAVADTTNVVWKLTAKPNGNYVQTDEETGTNAFKLNSSSTNYNGISDVTTSTNTGAMSFAANGDGFDMYGTYNTGRHLGLSASTASVQSSAQTLYIFKYSTTGGSQSYYATTLEASAPITHSYAASISPASLALHPGETGSVSATLTDNGATVSGATPTYTTSLASVATVAADGTVTAVANGNATITATYTVGGNDYTATCAVTVTTLATYTVTYMVNGSQYGETESVTQGSSPSFTAPSYDVSSYNAHAYEFLGWKEGSALSGDTTEAQTLYVAGNTHTISANTTYYAVYRYTEGGSATTAIGDLARGASADYVIAAHVGSTYYAMSNTFASKIDGTSITTTGSSVSSSDATGYAVTITKDSNSDTEVTIKSGSTYLTYASSTNLGTSSSAYTWTISSGTKGTYRLTSETAGRGLVYRADTTNKFGGYSTGNVTANGTEYYDVEIIPVGGSGTTYYATTLNVASAHTYVASITSSVTLTAGNDTTLAGTLTDNGITTTAYAPTYTSSDTSVVTVDSSTGYTAAISAGTATITVSYSVNGTTYSATCAVTVNAVSTEYAASYAVQSGVTYSGQSRSGNTITLPTAVSIPASYDAYSYTLVGWATATGADDTTKPTCYDPGDQVTITDDTTFYPVYSYSVGGGNATYNRITSTSDLTSGAKYLIVSEDGNRVMKSSNSSNTLANTYDTLTLDGSGTVTATSTLDGYAYTYQNSGFYGTNEKYISGTSGSNTINFPTSAAALTITFSGNNAVITSNTSVLRDNTGFRFYKAASSGTGNPVQLYKYTAGSGGGTLTYTFTLAASSEVDNYVGTVTATPSTVNLGGSTASLSATLTNNGNTVSSGDYSVSYAITSGSAASVSGSTLTSGSSAGSVTVTATFTVGGNTVATATCNVSVVDPNASVTVNYVGGSTGYVYNWGTRDTTATFLTAPTSSYYTGSYSYSTLSALTGSSTATAAAIYQSDLGTAIHNMLVAKQSSTTTYDGTKTLYKYTDCVGSNTSNMSSYYSGTTITNTWDSGSTWNREHTWPNSKGLNSSDENDIMMLRPTSVSENSSRGNTAYGSSGSYYDPNQHGQNLHGDIARLMLQHLMRWGNTSAFYGTSGVIESRAVLLQWLAEDPVDTWELGRNDAVERITGVRNVFVDYPELAFILLGASVPSNYTTPSSSGIVASATYNNTYGGSYQPVTNTSRIANPGVEYAVMDNEPVNETRGGATRTVGGENSDLPVTGAVMLNGIGQISNNDDVMSYLAQYGAQNCLVIPASGSVVFYLTGGSAESQIAIGASALNGTGTTLKVYQISAVSGSSATGTILVEQSLVSSTEMYFAINGIAWTGDKSNVLMVRNEGSAPMVLTNLRAVTGTVEGHISTGGDEGSSSVGSATRGITRGTEDELQMVIDASAILAGIAGVQSINEGTFDETPVDPVDPVDPVESDIVLRGNSISLNGQIDVNFYVDVPAELLADGVYATLDGVRADFTEGTYGTMVSKKLPAKEMNTKVTLKLYAADGTPLTFLNGSTAVTEHSYSVQDYLTYVIGNPATYGDELVKLCKAMSDYGSYTQRALGFDVDNAKAIYLADEIAAVTCTGCDYSFTANTENITFLGASVVTESETAIRVYFALSGEGFTATVDGEPAAIQTNERGTFVEIANISAKNLGDTHTIAVTNGTETVTVSNYSAYSYVQSVLSYAGASDSLKLAVKALKLYGDLAAEYFNK